MTKEERMINEAKRYYSGNIKCYDAFLHGIEFAEEYQKNIWHDVSKIPNNRKHIMFMSDPYTIKTGYIPVCLGHCKLKDDTWNKFVKDMNITKWAYVKDLLLKGGEK